MKTENLSLSLSLLFDNEKDLTKKLEKTQQAVTLYNKKQYQKLSEICFLRTKEKIDLFATLLPPSIEETVINSQVEISNEVLLQYIERVKSERNRGVFINILQGVQNDVEKVNDNYVFYCSSMSQLRYQLEEILEIKGYMQRLAKGGKVDISDIMKAAQNSAKISKTACC